jgi:PAS domain S-box-containing protein
VGRNTATAESTLSEVALTASVVAGLLDAAPDGILLIDADGRLLLVNARIEELFGYQRSLLLGQPVEMLLPEDLRTLHEQHRRDSRDDLRRRPMGAGLALRGRRSDGSEFPVDISLSPVTTNDGTWTVAAVRDDGDRQDVERKRREDAVSEEQTRIAEGLADTVIRGLFGTGLSLQALLDRPTDQLREGVEKAVEDIDETIRAVRGAIFGMRPGG